MMVPAVWASRASSLPGISDPQDWESWGAARATGGEGERQAAREKGMERREACKGRAPGSGTAGQEPPRRWGLIPSPRSGALRTHRELLGFGRRLGRGGRGRQIWGGSEGGLLWAGGRRGREALPGPRSRLGSGAGDRGRAPRARVSPGEGLAPGGARRPLLAGSAPGGAYLGAYFGAHASRLGCNSLFVVCCSTCRRGAGQIHFIRLIRKSRDGRKTC